jgi:predicted DNA-binding transcriptional regulator AlpA
MAKDTSARDERAFLTRDGLCLRWGISRASSYRLERDGYLTRPVRLGRGIARWPLAEIEAIEQRASEDRGGAR